MTIRRTETSKLSDAMKMMLMLIWSLLRGPALSGSLPAQHVQDIRSESGSAFIPRVAYVFEVRVNSAMAAPFFCDDVKNFTH